MLSLMVNFFQTKKYDMAAVHEQYRTCNSLPSLLTQPVTILENEIHKKYQSDEQH